QYDQGGRPQDRPIDEAGVRSQERDADRDEDRAKNERVVRRGRVSDRRSTRAGFARGGRGWAAGGGRGIDRRRRGGRSRAAELRTNVGPCALQVATHRLEDR